MTRNSYAAVQAFTSTQGGSEGISLCDASAGIVQRCQALTTLDHLSRRFVSSFLHGALAIGLAMGLHGQALSQTTVKMTAEPQETWGHITGLVGFKTSAAVLAALNGQQDRLFATCLAQNGWQQTFQCRKMVLTGIRPNPQFPLRVNGNYTYFLVDGYWHDQGMNAGTPYSNTTDAPGYDAIRLSLICPDAHGLVAKITDIGPNEQRKVCVKYQASPLQCDTCVLGKPAGTGTPGTAGNPLTVVGSNKVDRHLDYVTRRGRLKLVREFKGQLTGWKFPGSSVLADLFSPSAATYSISQTYLGNTFSDIPGQGAAFEYTLDFPLIRTTEHGEAYRLNGDGTATIYPAKADGTFSIGIDGDRLMRVVPTGADGTSWRWYRANNEVEELGTDGRPRRVYWPNGEYLTYAYDGGRLLAINDAWGRQLTPVYDLNNQVGAYRLPDGTMIRYGYNGRLLLKVTYADDSEKGLIYSEPANSPYGMWAPLTGLVDEIGRRVATYRYNSAGRAISTEGANGVNRYVVSEGGSSSVVTPPVGGNLQISFGVQNGSVVVTRRDIPAGAGSPVSNTAYTYDSAGNITRVLGYTGIASCHGYDLSRNIETARVEGLSWSANCDQLLVVNTALPAGGRKISTVWHPDWRLESLVAEPGRITTSVYNGQPDPFAGNALASCAPSTALLPDGKPIAVLCKQVEQATTDANGSQGFAAALQAGVANRVTTWTYNQWGQVLTENGPRTDVNDTTTYAYYSDTTADHMPGDLQSVTNAAGRVTQYSKYNRHGQLLESTDPNGVVTVNTYDLRQRLLSTTVGGQTTSYTYDPAGQLKRITLPDTSWVGYDYDDAHRQVAVYDHKGNRTEYLLDNAGNRIGETTRDPGGALKRQLSRSIDALGRVQQTTGRE